MKDKHGVPLNWGTNEVPINSYDLYRQIWGTKRANLSAAVWVDGQPTYSPGHGTVWYLHGHDDAHRGQYTLGCIGTHGEKVLNWLTASATGETGYNTNVPLLVSVKRED